MVCFPPMIQVDIEEVASGAGGQRVFWVLLVMKIEVEKKPKGFQVWWGEVLWKFF